MITCVFSGNWSGSSFNPGGNMGCGGGKIGCELLRLDSFGIGDGGNMGTVSVVVFGETATMSSMSTMMDPMLGYVGSEISKDR